MMKSVGLVLMITFMVMLATTTFASPNFMIEENTAANNKLVIPLSEIMLAEGYAKQLGQCRKCGEKCGPLYWCCPGCSCGLQIIIGEFRCS